MPAVSRAHSMGVGARRESPSDGEYEYHTKKRAGCADPGTIKAIVAGLRQRGRGNTLSLLNYARESPI